jgi:hypothetical protein
MKMMKMKLSVATLSLLLISLTAGDGCSAAQQQAVANTAVTISQDLCKEVANQPNTPEWVTLACTVGNAVVNVVMPKTEWASIKARKLGVGDAGTIVTVPGK